MSTHLIKLDEQKQEIDQFRALAMIAMKSGQYGQMSQETMLNIMLTAKDLGISPMKALNGGFYIVNGKISMSTAMMADRIRKEGHSIKIPEWTSEKCVIIGVRKDNGDSIKFEFTMQDAVNAGLANSATWKKFPKQMLYNRAMSTLARTLFPDVVGNAYSEDEKYDIQNIPPDQRPLEDPTTITVQTSRVEKQKVESSNSISDLESLVVENGVSAEGLVDFLQFLAVQKGKSIEEIIESAMLPEIFPRFLQMYSEKILKKSA
jgi:RecT family protein